VNGDATLMVSAPEDTLETLVNPALRVGKCCDDVSADRTRRATLRRRSRAGGIPVSSGA
jgi:hypothetical protein